MLQDASGVFLPSSLVLALSSLHLTRPLLRVSSYVGALFMFSSQAGDISLRALPVRPFLLPNRSHRFMAVSPAHLLLCAAGYTSYLVTTRIIPIGPNGQVRMLAMLLYMD